MLEKEGAKKPSTIATFEVNSMQEWLVTTWLYRMLSIETNLFLYFFPLSL